MFAVDLMGNAYEKEKGLPNESEFYCGPSGTGKTTVLIKRALELAKGGKKVLSLAFHGAGCRELLDSELRCRYESNLHVKKVREGLSLPYQTERGLGLDIEFSRVLGNAFSLAPTYIECVAAAIRKAIEYGDLEKRGLISILDNLRLIDTATARHAYIKLAPVIGNISIRNGDLMTDKAITELNFDGIQMEAQIHATELVLGVILQAAENDMFLPNGIVIMLDELHKISAEKDSAFRNLIEIGRKKGISFLLASPEIPFGRRSVSALAAQQCSIVAYFRPGHMDTRRLARAIAPSEMADCCLALNRLQRGEFIVGGGLEMVGGDPIQKARVLRIPDTEEIEKASTYGDDSGVEKRKPKVTITVGSRGRCEI